MLSMEARLKTGLSEIKYWQLVRNYDYFYSIYGNNGVDHNTYMGPSKQDDLEPISLEDQLIWLSENNPNKMITEHGFCFSDKRFSTLEEAEAIKQIAHDIQLLSSMQLFDLRDTRNQEDRGTPVEATSASHITNFVNSLFCEEKLADDGESVTDDPAHSASARLKKQYPICKRRKSQRIEEQIHQECETTTIVVKRRGGRKVRGPGRRRLDPQELTVPAVRCKPHLWRENPRRSSRNAKKRPQYLEK